MHRRPIAGLVGWFGPEWVGVSVTMPGKFAALAFADERTERAELVGSANTLVRTPTGWRADNTDVDGVVGALGSCPAASPARRSCAGRAAPRRRPCVGLAELGVTDITVVARDAAKAARLLELAAAGRHHDAVLRPGRPRACRPGGGRAGAGQHHPGRRGGALRRRLRRVPVLLDAVYDPWPTPLAAAVADAGGHVIGGVQMLLHQAFAQVEQFTGRPAPREAMGAAMG